MSHGFTDGVRRIEKVLGDLPIHANKLGGHFEGHANKMGELKHVFHDADVDGSSTARHLPSSGTLGGSDLTPDQSDAIKDYAGSAYQLNARLRAEQSGSEYMSSLDTLDHHLGEALDRLPSYEGRTYRGTNLPDEILDSMRPGGTHTDAGYTSTSTELNVAEGFREGGDSNALITIDGSSGRDISGVSENPESEVLFPKGTTFDVVSKQQDGNGVWHIHLKER